MDISAIDQGTIIYGLRSSKYPTVPCYGVIITARCDIAQKKVPKYYFLVAVDASQWFCTEHGYGIVYQPLVKSFRSNIGTMAGEVDLNGDVLVSLSSSDLETVMEDKRSEYSGNRTFLKKLDNLAEKLDT